MIKVTVIALGKLKEKYLREAVEEYAKRLGRYCSFSVKELEPVRISEKPSENEIMSALRREAEDIRRVMPKSAYKIALCVEGKKMSSEEFSSCVLSGKSELVFIIGSSHGLYDELKRECDLRLSVSDMTFPHQLFRVMLSEQIYRAFKIGEGSAYHK